MSDAVLPVFPLGGVLFPTLSLSLHVFEPRYRALARFCVEGDGHLGVVLIERGSEVGGGDVRFDVGTLAQITEAFELDDGRWGLVAVGGDRFRVDRWLPEEPYPRAEVTWRPDVGPASDDPTSKNLRRSDEMVALLRRVLALRAELGEAAASATVVIDADPAVATWQCAALAPLGALDAQRLLVLDAVDERLDLMLSLLGDEAHVLALRMAGG